MSFINSREDKQYRNTVGMTCLDVFIETNSVRLEEGFTFKQLEELKEELLSVVTDIDYILECED